MKTVKIILDMLKKSLMASSVMAFVGCLFYIGGCLIVSSINALLNWHIYLGIFITAFAISLSYFIIIFVVDNFDIV